MPKVKRARSSSPALGGDTSYVKRTKTGRPARTSAGRKTLPAGYVLTDDVVDGGAAKEQPASDLDNDESTEDDEGERGRWSRPKPNVKSKNKKHKQQQRRGLSPAVPVTDDLNDVPEMTLEEIAKRDALKTSGPLDVHSSVSFAPGQIPNIITQLEQTLAALRGALQDSTSLTDAAITAAPDSNSIEGRTGFLDLPSELRNRIYRYALRYDKPVEFPPNRDRYHEKFSGGQFLATCQQVEREASEILYGENGFDFSRDRRSRGKFYEDKWPEVGWMDIHIFVQRLGAKNIGNIERLTIDLSDTSAQSCDEPDAHRCVNDVHLLAVFKLLAAHGRLRWLKLDVNVRASILKAYDQRFVEHMQAIKADKIIFSGVSERRYMPRTEKNLAKLSEPLRKECIEKMERKVKLYG